MWETYAVEADRGYGFVGKSRSAAVGFLLGLVEDQGEDVTVLPKRSMHFHRFREKSALLGWVVLSTYVYRCTVSLGD